MPTMAELMKTINKECKEEIVHHGLAQYDYDRIPFTSPRLNYITHGGIPMGKLIEFYGEEHGGKTTTALDIVANFQRMPDDMKRGKGVLYLDAENTLDSVWATKLGVDLTRDIDYWWNPTNQGAETLFQWVLDSIDTGEIGLVVIDSLGVMVSNQAMEKTVAEKTYGGIAMALTNFSKKAEGLCQRHKCTIIGINQMRADMNSMYGGKTTTGGLAWKHNALVRMEFRKGKFFDEKYKDLSQRADNPVGNYVEVYMAKNKSCAPDRHTGFYTLRYDIGIDYLYDLTEVAMLHGWIEKKGAWFNIVNPETGEVFAQSIQGQANVYKFLEDEQNLPILEQIQDYLDKMAR